MIRIGLVDYKAGNLRSLSLALEKSGATAFLANKPKELENADGLVLPGMGSFSCVAWLAPLRNVLKNYAQAKPMLGICLGMQAAFESSEECPRVRGLSLLRGTVKRLGAPRLPQIGWNSIRLRRASALLRGIGDGERFYFANSYACFPEDDVTVASSEYGCEFAAVVEKGNFFGVQFHPEKSGQAGLRVLRNFVGLCEVPK